MEDLVDELVDNGYESDDSMASKTGQGSEGDVDFDRLGDFTCDPDLDFAMQRPPPDLSDLTDSELENDAILSNRKRSSDTANLDNTEMKLLKKKAYKKRRRREKRSEISGNEPYSKLVGNRRCNEANVITLDCRAAKLPVSTTGWQGVRKTGFEEYAGLSREETIALPWMRYLDWDGR